MRLQINSIYPRGGEQQYTPLNRKEIKMKVNEISKEELLERLELVSNIFAEKGELIWAGEMITDEETLRNKVKELLRTPKKIHPRHDTITIFPRLSIKIWDDLIEKAKAEQMVTIPTSEYNKLLQLVKENTYKVTDDDIDLLIEIENVLIKRSRQIWGLTHKKKIKGGGDITPYETGYDKLYDYMELVARIIG